MSAIPLHTRVERTLESGDMRLIYGTAVPLLLVVAGVAGLAVSGASWLVAPLMLAVVALTAVVAIGFAQMLGEDGDSDRP